jgi:hypothetical protein
MPYVQYAPSSRFRLLISGMSNSGKTTSFQTFIYGHHDYRDEAEQEQALLYADDKRMVVLVCPGEKGIKSLLTAPHITNYYLETADDVDITDVNWSTAALRDFNEITNHIVKVVKPDILICDGFHSLHEQLMNKVTGGKFLRGEDLNTSERTGRYDPYQSAKYYSQAHNAFGQYISALYYSSIPLIVCTTWEDWQSTKEESEAGKQTDIAANRYLWPAIPGAMATKIVGQFDARISARLERRCLHKQCEYSSNNDLHYVWQFLPKNDVMGCSIKGLRVNKAMKEKPWIHQNYADLLGLMATFAV